VVIKIFSEDLYWQGKLLVFTWHFKEEFDALHKPIFFVLDILEHGKHHLISRKQGKYNVLYPFKGKHLCLSYVKTENIILIHIKPTGKILEERRK
jgi:hypothetical protein